MKVKYKEKLYIYNRERENKKYFFCKKKLKFRQVTLKLTIVLYQSKNKRYYIKNRYVLKRILRR
ncbi:MAG: hypothetical protein FH751_08765 [Firmicutes bacterium]|nr:hypothetical protein [Bacillota bacterium]